MLDFKQGLWNCEMKEALLLDFYYFCSLANLRSKNFRFLWANSFITAWMLTADFTGTLKTLIHLSVDCLQKLPCSFWCLQITDPTSIKRQNSPTNERLSVTPSLVVNCSSCIPYSIIPLQSLWYFLKWDNLMEQKKFLVKSLPSAGLLWICRCWRKPVWSQSPFALAHFSEGSHIAQLQTKIGRYSWFFLLINWASN